MPPEPKNSYHVIGTQFGIVCTSKTDDFSAIYHLSFVSIPLTFYLLMGEIQDSPLAKREIRWA